VIAKVTLWFTSCFHYSFALVAEVTNYEQSTLVTKH